MIRTVIKEPPPNLDRAREVFNRAHAVIPSRSLLRLEDTLRRGDTSATQLSQLIDGSPALAARVLRMANSPFYAPAEPVVSLSRAVPILGHTVTRQLVLATLVRARQTAQGSARQGVAAARLTGNAVRAAVIARALAAGTRLIAPDEAFAAGLLHDIGHMYLLADAGDAYAAYVLDETPADSLLREVELTGTTHQELGAAFAHDWNLPAALGAVMGAHHDPEPRTLGAILAAADALVAEAYHPSLADSDVALGRSDVALDAAGSSRAAWESVAATVRVDYAALLTVSEFTSP